MKEMAPDIRFYDFEFRLLHVENQFISSNWNICYNDIGTFEARFDMGSDTLPIVLENDYLIAVQGDFSAVITGKKLDSGLALYGRSCNWLLTKRVTNKFPVDTPGIYDPVTNAVLAAFFDAPVVAGEPVDVPEITDERSDKCETFQVVQEVLAQKNLGHSLEFDYNNARWIFQIRKGNPSNPLVISSVNRNACDVVMSGDSLAFYSEGWYQEKLTEGGTVWKQVRNLSVPEKYRSGMYRFECLLSGSSESEALSALKKARRTDSIQGKTFGIRFGAGNDYLLGDEVLVEWQCGNHKKRSRKRIVGVNLWYESGNSGEEPVFEELEDTVE